MVVLLRLIGLPPDSNLGGCLQTYSDFFTPSLEIESRLEDRMGRDTGIWMGIEGSFFLGGIADEGDPRLDSPFARLTIGAPTPDPAVDLVVVVAAGAAPSLEI